MVGNSDMKTLNGVWLVEANDFPHWAQFCLFCTTHETMMAILRLLYTNDVRFANKILSIVLSLNSNHHQFISRS